MFFQTVRNACKTMLPQLCALTARPTLNQMASIVPAVSLRSFHLLSSSVASRLQTNIIGTGSNLLTAPALPQLTQKCGFKVKGRLRRRCRDCFFVTRHGRLYNICYTHPRHKQMAMQKRPKSTWILTHATQSKVRPW